MTNFKNQYYFGAGSFEEPNEHLYKEAVLIAIKLVEYIKLPLGWSDYEESYNVYEHLYSLESHKELFERVRDVILPEAAYSSPYYEGLTDDKLLRLISDLAFSNYASMYITKPD